jgi:hypothetical protein
MEGGRRVSAQSIRLNTLNTLNAFWEKIPIFHSRSNFRVKVFRVFRTREILRLGVQDSRELFALLLRFGTKTPKTGRVVIG